MIDPKAPFAVDLERGVILLMDGTEYQVDEYRNAVGEPCDSKKAALAIFKGPHEQWFALDFRPYHMPDAVH